MHLLLSISAPKWPGSDKKLCSRRFCSDRSLTDRLSQNKIVQSNSFFNLGWGLCMCVCMFASWPVRRSTGSTVRRFTGSTVRRFTGSPVHRFAQLTGSAVMPVRPEWPVRTSGSNRQPYFFVRSRRFEPGCAGSATGSPVRATMGFCTGLGLSKWATNGLK